MALLVLSLPASLLSQGGLCGNISFSLQSTEPCCYQFNYSNNSECYRNGRILVSDGSLLNLTVNTAAGFTATQISSTEIEFNHNQGFFPLGAQSPLTFCLPPSVSPTVTVLWDMYCGMGEGCFQEIPVVGCSPPSDATISGVKYLECGQLPYSNQVLLPGWEIQLLNSDGLIVGQTPTDNNGAYAFYDLPPGNYIVKELAVTGWTPKVPPIGQYAIDLITSQNLTLNFGNCPGCSCDSIYVDVLSLGSDSSNNCAYGLVLQNTGGYCFDEVNISLASGTISSWTITQTGWEVVQLDSQHIELLPPNGYVPLDFSYPIELVATGGTEHVFTVTTHLIINGMTTSCAKVFTRICPVPVVPSCCPAGTVQGPELTTNGDFSAGNTGFITGFTYFSPGNFTAKGKYSVLQGNQIFAANTQWACVSGSPTDKMLIIDGHNSISDIAWRNYVNVQLGDLYDFCARVNNLVVPYRDYDNPVVELWINFTKVATVTLNETPDTWISLNSTWVANVAGLVPIDIRLGNTGGAGNDFAVDDISFRACITPPPCDASFTFTNACCGNVQFNTPTSGLTYLWNFGDGQTSTQQNPLHTFPSCANYTVCLTLSGPNCPSQQICQQVFAGETILPTITCIPNVMAVLDANCAATVSVGDMAVYSDNCTVTSAIAAPSTFTNCGNFDVGITVTDCCGNVAHQFCTLQVKDNTPPTINCPPPYSTECNINVGANITGMATATDNCVVTNINHTDLLFSQLNQFPDGPCDNFIERTWRATDGCGNMSTCVQIINVHDDVVPVLTNCPPNITVTGTIGPNGLCSANVQVASPTVTDNCDLLVALTNSFNGTVNASGNYPSGNTTVTWTASDDCGNLASCSVVVTVNCNACNCNAEPVTLTQGGTSYTIPCNLHGLPDSALPKFGCPAGAITATGNMGCIGQNGTACQSTIWYELTDPLANVSMGYGPLPVTLAASQVSVPGTYSLTFYTYCQGSVDTCICNLRWKQESCDSCTCPLDSTPSLNLVTNGNFSLGDYGFSSMLAGSVGGQCQCTSGSYCVSDNLNDKCAGWPNFCDHTAPCTGNMMIVDGDPTNMPIIWSQTVSVVPGMTYCFSYWTLSAYSASQQEFNLGVEISGYDNSFNLVSNLLGTSNIMDVFNPNPHWINHFYTWTCPLGFNGPYTLEMKQYSGIFGDGYADFGLDDICFTKTEPVVNACCDNYQNFCDRVENAVTVSVDNSHCKATLNVGSFNGCDDYLEWIKWGDQTGQQQGPYPPSSMPMHTYSSGTYEICYLAIERNSNGLICFEKVVCDTITVFCDSCNCQSDLTLTHGSASQPVFCNTSILYQFLCPIEDVTVSGFFGCVNSSTGEVCPNTTVSWTLDRPGNLASIPGSVLNFQSVTFPASDLDEPGDYCLTLWTLCPGMSDTCFCKIRWQQTPCDTCDCSADGTASPSLVTNGNFEQGDNFFNSDLPSSNQCTGTNYWVGNNLNVLCSGWPNVPDHTTGTGNLLIIDGDETGAATLWGQTVSIVPCSTYCFSFWTASAYPPSLQNFNLDIVVLDGSGNPIVPMVGIANILQTSPPWSNHAFTWTCPCNAVGPFTLQINQQVPGGYVDFGIDDICFGIASPPTDSCCANLEDFCARVENATTVTVDNSLCKAKLNVGNLPACDYIDYVIWGDGTQDGGDIPGGGMAMHTYAASGTYIISYLAIETNSSGIICFEKFLHDTIVVVCDPCCKDQAAFLNAAALVQTNGTLGDCTINFSATGLNDCMQISYLWGDNPITWQGPFGNNVSVSHSYAGPGTYNICYRIEEVDADDNVCWNYEKCEAVTVLCENCKSLSDGLYGYFPFIANADDYNLFNPQHGTVIGATLTTGHDGAVNSAYHFNGNPDGINCTANTRNVSNAVSVCAWVRTSETVNGQWIAGQYDGFNGGGDKGYLLSIGDVTNASIGQAAFTGRDGTGIYHHSGFSQKPINDGEWHCLVGTAGLGVSGTNEWRIYVDGSNPTDGNSSPGSTINLATSINQFTIGKHSDPTLPPVWMYGDIDNVLVYNRVLTEEEVDCFCDGYTASEEVVIYDDIVLYPNPTSNSLTLEFTGAMPKAGAIQILDIYGRLMQMESLTPNEQTHQLSISALPVGMYFVRVTDGGVPVWAEKVVKQ